MRKLWHVKDCKKIRVTGESQPRWISDLDPDPHENRGARLSCHSWPECGLEAVGEEEEAGAALAGDEGRRGGPARPAAGEGAAPEARARGEERTGGGARRGGGRCGGGDGAGRRRSGRRRRSRGGRGAGARARGGPSWASRAGTAAAMWSCHVAAPEWSGAPADVSGQAADMSVGGWELFFLASVSDGGRRDPNGGGINRHRGS